MKRILNRDVNVCGKIYPSGTDVEKLPEGNRTSVVDSGWTVEVDDKVDEPSEGESSESTDNKSQVDSTDSTGQTPTTETSDDQSAESTGSNEPDGEQKSDEQKPADTRPLSELGLAADKLELLANNDPPITTVQQALDFVEVNKTFRTIAGFGKAADQDLRRQLGVL